MRGEDIFAPAELDTVGRGATAEPSQVEDRASRTFRGRTGARAPNSNPGSRTSQISNIKRADRSELELLLRIGPTRLDAGGPFRHVASASPPTAASSPSRRRGASNGVKSVGAWRD
ncbi:hypothetical protein NL676_035953 [Syzygium grande]|nr:hypothetical protein NL676_035953 [Syzygium grande]